MKQVINTLKGRAASGQHAGISRRKALLSGGGMLAAATMLKQFDAAAAERGGTTPPNLTNAGRETRMITMKDGAEIFFKDWGSSNAQPIVFHHGWPLSADDWDAQMLYFVQKGYRVIAHDRRVMDVAAVVAHLGLRNAIHIGHSTAGGEALHYAARRGKGRVAKLVLVGAVPPICRRPRQTPME